MEPDDDFEELDEFDDDVEVIYDFGDEPYAEPHPELRPSQRLARSVAGAMMVGVGNALQEIYESRPKQESAIVWEASDDEPDPDDPFWLEFDPDDPSASVIHIRCR